jgi:alpha-tubulin suppressor-like RCC1 family protein
MKSMAWGEQHGLMLDKKGRVFSMGRMINGVLGLSETNQNDTKVENPT